MTATVTGTTIATIWSHINNALTTTFGLVAILLLIMLLLLKEIIRTKGGVKADRQLKILDIAIIPLLVVFGLVIIMRLVALL